MLDRLGIIGSSVCAIHCALPLILSFMSPSLSSLFGNEWIHFTLLALVIPLALFSFLKSQKLHKNKGPLLLGAFGIFILIAAITLEGLLGSKFQSFELFTTVSGSLILILSHLLNLQLLTLNSKET